uniref:Uncharacterized protein n=2 Tax=Theileria parva TaxID=5875 RepID=Q4N7B7_THEPA|eukprot:XP_766424.1 hypothetical protein [Theileria parva strain Muguga]
MLLKHCDKDTSVNFECFRCLGECISIAARAALMDKEHGEKFDDEL